MDIQDRTTGKLYSTHHLPESIRERIADSVEWESEDERHKITGDIDVFNGWLHENYDVHTLEEILSPSDGSPIPDPEIDLALDNPGYRHYKKMCALYPDEELRMQVAEDALARAMDSSRPLPPGELVDDDDYEDNDYHQW